MGAPTQVKLNIPQLTFAKLAQVGRYESVSESCVSIPTEGKWFVECIWFPLRSNTKRRTLSILCNYGKTRMDQKTLNTLINNYMRKPISPIHN